MQNNKTFVMSPIGTAQYVYLTEPDFGNGSWSDAVGTYKVKNMTIPAGQDADAFFAKLTSAADAYFAEASKKAGNKPLRRAPLPFYKKDEGDYYLTQTTLKAGGVNSTTKQQFTQKPRIFNANGKPWEPSNRVTNGSKLRVIVEVVPYSNPSQGHGITLRLKDVQVVELGVYRKPDEEDNPFGVIDNDDSDPFADVSPSRYKPYHNTRQNNDNNKTTKYHDEDYGDI